MSEKMRKPLGTRLLGGFYLMLGVGVIIAYIYLVVTDYSIITLSSYDAGDVIYTAEAAEFILVYVLAPALFIGGTVAVPGSILILTQEGKRGEVGYYLMLLASVIWSLLLIGLIAIVILLKKDHKQFYITYSL